MQGRAETRKGAEGHHVVARLPASPAAARGAVKSNCGKENYFVSQKKIDGPDGRQTPMREDTRGGETEHEIGME